MEVVTNQKGGRTLLLDGFAYTTQRLVLVQATAGSSRPRKRKRYERSSKYTNRKPHWQLCAHWDWPLSARDCSRCWNTHIGMTTFFSLQVLRQSQHIAHSVRHSDFRHFHCQHFDIPTFWLRHCDCWHFHCRHFDSAPTIVRPPPTGGFGEPFHRLRKILQAVWFFFAFWIRHWSDVTPADWYSTASIRWHDISSSAVVRRPIFSVLFAYGCTT